MKKKFNLWLNIATICLCVCAVAIGVYAAQSATLTVSGKVGFTAHGVVGTVSGTIVGHSNEGNAAPITTPESLGSEVNFDSTSGISLGNRYFSDVTDDRHIETIKITLTITNKTVYPVKATLTLPDYQTNLTYDGSNFIATLGAKDSATAQQEMIIEMTLDSAKANSFNLTDIEFKLTFDKYELIEGNSTTGYYVTMGSNIVTDSTGKQVVKPVKWIPFAKHVGTSTTGADENGYIAFSKTEKPVDGGKYYFVSENILDLGLDTASKYEQYGVAYANQLDSNYKSTKTNYTTFYAQDYLISNVRELLTSETGVQQYALYNSSTGATPYGSKISLLKEYGLQGYTYASITKRSAEELHEKGYDNKELNDFQDAEKTASDSLWLLSQTEANTYFSDNTARVANLFRATETTAGSWWLRSPSSNLTYYAWYVYSSGDVSDNSVYDALGVRPAFTLTI